jgi:hypothetical protein
MSARYSSHLHTTLVFQMADARERTRRDGTWREATMNADEWLLAFPPDCRNGYSTDRLRAVLGGGWPAFDSFMTGRSYTSEAGPDGRTMAVAYLDDVWRFVGGGQVPLPEPAPRHSEQSARAATPWDLPPLPVQRVRLQLDHVQRSVTPWLMDMTSIATGWVQAVKSRSEPAAPVARFSSSQARSRLLAHR